MKNILLILAFLPLSLFSQNTVVDSVHIENCTTFTSQATLHDDVHIDSVRSIYNSGGQLITRITTTTYLRDGSATYFAAQMDSLIYDSIANSIETLSGSYANFVFTPTTARKVTNDVSGKVISVAVAQYYPVYNLFYYYSYLPNNLLDSYFRVIDLSGNLDTLLSEYTYDANWNQIREEFFVWDNGAIARPAEKKDQYFNMNNQLIAYDWELWIDSTLGYEDCYIDSGSFTYDVNGRLIERFINSCPGGDITYWYTYDVNGNLDSTGHVIVNNLQDTSWQTCNAGTGVIINNINSNLSKESFFIYPNPTNGKVILNGNLSASTDEISIIDLMGRIVLTKKVAVIKNSVVEVDLSELTAGVYVLQVFGKEMQSKLFVKE